VELSLGDCSDDVMLIAEDLVTVPRVAEIVARPVKPEAT
jgi:hypothetical protein